MWNALKCDFCGDCLVECRYADFDRDKAVQEMKLLAEGKEADILALCITCVACTNSCPTGADPSNLIFQMQEKIGTAPLVVNTKPVCEALAKGLEGRGAPVEIIPGDIDQPVLSFDSFEYKQFPEGTLDSRLFKGLTKVRGPEYMSLTGCVHMGGESLIRKYAGKVIDKLAELGKDIVYLHNEGYALAKVKTAELGISVPFKFRHLYEYLLYYLKTHRGEITPLNKKVAYQANCASRWLPEQEAWLDEIFSLIKVERPLRQYDKLNALCCGGPIMGANRNLAIEIQENNIKDALDCGAEAMITMCPVCDAVLRRPTSKMGLPKIFITDLCRMALGEIPWPDKSA